MLGCRLELGQIARKERPEHRQTVFSGLKRLLGRVSAPPSSCLVNATSVCHGLDRTHRVISFSSRYFLHIRPELAAGSLKMLEHFLPERFRPVIEQRESKVEQILIMVSFHCIFLSKRGRKQNPEQTKSEQT